MHVSGSIDDADAQKSNVDESKIVFPETESVPQEIPEVPEELDTEQIIRDIGLSKYNDYQQLAYLGKLTDEYEAFGHTFKARTITAEEELKLSSYLIRYQDAISWNKALWIEALAYSIEEVDGEPLAPMPLERDYEDKLISAKREVLKKWSPSVINELYNIIYLDLRERERQVVEFTKKSHRAGRKESVSGSQIVEESSRDQQIT